MLNPNYNNDVTVFHKAATGKWSSKVYSECSFVYNVSRVIDSLGSETVTGSYTCRIPAEYDAKLSRGDIVILGAVRGKITNEAPYTATELMERFKPNAFRVNSVVDNTGHMVDKHIKAVG